MNDTETNGVTEEEVLTELSLILGADKKRMCDLKSDLYNSRVQNRIEECNAEFSDLPYSLGGMSIGGEMGYLAMRLMKPTSIFEIGVANGLSTLYLLGGADHEHLTDIDIRGLDKPRFEQDVRNRRGKRGVSGVGGIVPDNKSAGWIAPKQQRSKFGYQYYVGDFTQISPVIPSDMGNLDLALYDASKDSSEMEFAFSTLINGLNTGGILIADDINRNNAFEDVCQKYNGEYSILGSTGIFRLSAQS